MENNAILTEDNMIKRQWKGDPSCYFCNQHESVPHLLFTCSIAKVVWTTIASCLDANDIPTSFSQSWKWCEKWIPNGKQFFIVRIAAICWSIWKMRNKICFNEKILHNQLKSYAMHVHSWNFGQVFKRKVTGRRWSRESTLDTMLKIVVQLLTKPCQVAV